MSDIERPWDPLIWHHPREFENRRGGGKRSDTEGVKEVGDKPRGQRTCGGTLVSGIAQKGSCPQREIGQHEPAKCGEGCDSDERIRRQAVRIARLLLQWQRYQIMSTSVLALAKSLLTTELLAKAAALTGESGTTTASALHALIPSVIGGFADQAATPDGATGLFYLLESLPSLTDMGDLTAWIQAGKPLLASIFGERLNAALDVVTSASGVRQASAGSLAALAASLVASVLAGKARETDPTELAALLSAERTGALAAAPGGMTSVLESGGFAFRHILPMILTGMVLLAVPFLYRSCDQPVVVVAAPRIAIVEPPKLEKVELPGGMAINVLPGTINYELARFLAGSDPVPRTFVFDHLNFEFATTVITKESEPTLTDLVAILKAYPAVDTRLEGHTDNVGDPLSNKKLSEDRAAAIEKFLVTTGIDTKRIETTGYGEEKPLESNETDAGRAKNRRLELVVVKK